MASKENGASSAFHRDDSNGDRDESSWWGFGMMVHDEGGWWGLVMRVGDDGWWWGLVMRFGDEGLEWGFNMKVGDEGWWMLMMVWNDGPWWGLIMRVQNAGLLGYAGYRRPPSRCRDWGVTKGSAWRQWVLYTVSDDGQISFASLICIIPSKKTPNKNPDPLSRLLSLEKRKKMESKEEIL